MVSIIILVQDRYNEVKRCVESILEKTFHTQYELVIIMQSVKDQRIIELIENLPCRKTIAYNEVNTGVTPGRNQGMLLSKGEYLLFFDDDAYVSEELQSIPEEIHSIDWLGRMMLPYAYDIDLGIVSQSGSYINPFRPGVFWSNLPRNTYCDVGQGYCFFFSRKVMDSIGLLDETFGKFWHEESEYSLRAKKAGFKVLSCDYIGVTHVGSSSGDDGSYGRKIDYMFRKWQRDFDTILEFPAGKWINNGERPDFENKGSS